MDYTTRSPTRETRGTGRSWRTGWSSEVAGFASLAPVKASGLKLKFIAFRSEASARKLLKIAGIEPVQDSRIYIEKINKPFLRMRLPSAVDDKQ